MSWKIHEAYRLRSGFDVWETAGKIRRSTLKAAHACLVKLYPLILSSDVISEAGAILGRRPTNTMDASRVALTMYKQNRNSEERNAWDLDVSVTWRRLGRHWLMIPYPGSGYFAGTLEHLRRNRALEDYHYQTSSDRPSHINARAWAARGRVWERAHGEKDSNWGHMFSQNIITPSVWYEFDPAWMVHTRSPIQIVKPRR